MLERSYRDESSPETVQLYKPLKEPAETETFGCQNSHEYFNMKVTEDDETEHSFLQDAPKT